jgi:hypothetical protein
VTAAYPSALLNWTARVNSQTIFAVDPNTLADEIDAVETFVGLNPQVEPSGLTGSQKAFASMSARLSAAYLQSGHPYIEVSGTQQRVFHSTSSGGIVHAPFGFINKEWPGYISSGNIVIKDAGIWLVNTRVVWDYATSGWVQHVLLNGNSQLRRSVFNYSMFPSSGSNSFGERFINQFGMTETTYMGRLTTGSVISTGVGNYTNRNPLPIESMSMSAYFLRP